MKVDKLKFAVLGALMLPLSAVVVAEEAKSAFSVSGNVGLYSDYIFRGYTQTKNDPASICLLLTIRSNSNLAMVLQLLCRRSCYNSEII